LAHAGAWFRRRGHVGATLRQLVSSTYMVAFQVPVLPELVLAELPRGTHVLVMTHDHAEDVALCDAAIRLDHLGPIGLIGSSAKWARFRAQLLADGHDESAVARITLPIGMPGVTTSKEPASIAVSVAAALLAAFEREGARQGRHGA
jgi:xanthine dehydrogenase accessory factor